MSVSYVFPQRCSVCMGPAETQQLVSRSKTSGSLQMSCSVHVPICRACKEKHFDAPSKTLMWFVIVVSALGGFVGAVAGGGSRDVGWLGGAFIGLVVGGIIGGGLFSAFDSGRPVRIRLEFNREPELEFDNKEYYKLFHDANWATHVGFKF
jgi:hypothetical protein